VKKKCLLIQSKIDRFLRGELSQTRRQKIAIHLGECDACSKYLEFCRKLDATADSSVEVPESLTQRVHALQSDRAAVNRTQRRLKFHLGDPLMKKIVVSSAALSAICVGIALFAPSRAPAASPQAAFLAMKKAILSDQKLADVITSPLKKGVKVEPAALNKSVQVVYWNQPNVKWPLDLDPKEYSQIRFGQTQNRIWVIPKSNPMRRDEWVLHEATHLPKSWTSYTLKPTGWVQQAFLKFNLVNGTSGEYSFDPKSGEYNVVPK